MNGSAHSDLGLISLTALEIFDKAAALRQWEKMENQETDEAKEAIRQHGSILPPGVVKKRMRVCISYMEIYNENVNDLLSRGNTNLEVREDR